MERRSPGRHRPVGRNQPRSHSGSSHRSNWWSWGQTRRSWGQTRRSWGQTRRSWGQTAGAGVKPPELGSKPPVLVLTAAISPDFFSPVESGRFRPNSASPRLKSARTPGFCPSPGCPASPLNNWPSSSSRNCRSIARETCRAPVNSLGGGVNCPRKWGQSLGGGVNSPEVGSIPREVGSIPSEPRHHSPTPGSPAPRRPCRERAIRAGGGPAPHVAGGPGDPLRQHGQRAAGLLELRQRAPLPLEDGECRRVEGVTSLEAVPQEFPASGFRGGGVTDSCPRESSCRGGAKWDLPLFEPPRGVSQTLINVVAF